MRISASTNNGMGPLGTDFLPPVITPAANVTIEATGPTTAVNLVAATVVDNVDPNPVVTATPVGPYPVGVNVVTWTATDAAGNIGTATQTITVTDTIVPVIAAPVAKTFSTASPTIAADITAHLATVTATDAVGVVLPITNNAPLLFPVGNTTVTYTVTDVAGNVGTATTVITVSAASIINMANATTLATRLTQFDPNINFTLPVATAALNQTGLVETTNFGTLGLTPLTLPQTGIMLTTGNVSGTGNNLGPLIGDADVFNALTNHISFASTGTSDAALLQFSFTVPANTPSVSFDLIYATNETLAGVAFPDAVVVMIDGVNRATFTNGLLLSNLNGAFLTASNGNLISGYTNLSQAQTLTALLNPALATHTIKISIADNSTSLVDSALIISNMRVAVSNQNGIGPIGVDFLAPAITPAANITIEATGPTTTVNLGTPTVVDNVDPNPVVTAAPVGPYPVGATIVTWSATDAAGNIGTATQTVTVTDTTPPLVFAPIAQTFSTASPTMAADIAAHLATVAATDAVGVILPIINNAPLVFPVGNTTVVYTIADAAGNIGTASTVITVTAASILNVTNATTLATRLTQFDPNITFSLPAATIAANQAGLVETTNFGTLAALPPLAATPLTLPQTGIILSTGNTSGTGNNLGPLAGDTDVFNALSAHPSFATIGTADAASLQFSFTVPANTPSINFDLIYATNELLGGIALPDAVVIMVDGVNRATFANGLLLSNLNGAFLNTTNGTLVSGFTNLSPAQTLTALLDPALATHTIKITIADNTTATVDSAIILSNMRISASTNNGMGPVGADFLPPVITPAANITIEAIAPTTPVNLGAPTVVDNLDPNPTLVAAPVGPYPVGATIVTWTATDAAGNIGTATQTVTVIDTTVPAIVAPVAQTFSTVSATLAADIAAHLATVTATDAVGVVLPITNNAPLAFPVGNTTVTFTATDLAGNAGTATTVITVSAANIINMNNATTLATRLTQFDPNINFTLPVATALATQTGLVETTNFGTLVAAPLTLPQPGIILTTGNVTGTGNSLGPLPGDTDVFNALNTHPLFATAGTADAASLQFSFTVPANTPSVSFDLIYATNEVIAGIASPDAVVVMVDGVNRATFATGLLLSNLNGAFLSPTNGTLVSGYTNLSPAQVMTTLLNPVLTTHTIKISIADNSTALVDSALIISNMRVSASTQNSIGPVGADFLPPVITPAANIFMEATGPTTTVNLGVPNVIDNVDPNPTVTSAPAGPFPVGATVVTWSATDIAGNIGTATQLVTINDTTAPLITAPVAQTFSTASPTLAADITTHLATVTATDAVSVILPILNDAPLLFPVGNTTVTFTSTDAAGNVGTATTVITVSAASILNVTNATSLATRLTQFDANINFTLPVATGIANQTGLVESTNFGTLGLAPLTLPQKSIILTTGNFSGTGNNLGPLAGDADVFNALSGHPSYATVGTADAASLQFSFTVPANTPSVSFDLIYATNEGIAGTALPDAAVIMVDGINRGIFNNGQLLSNLNGAFLTVSNGALISGYTNLSPAQTVTTLLDPLLTTHTLKISIADNTTATVDSALIISNMRISTSNTNGMGPLGVDFLPPAVTPAANITIEATGPTTAVNLGAPTVVDNIDPNPALVAAPAGPYPVGVTVVTWTATDAAGNIGTSTQTVTVNDTITPVITPPAAQTFSTVSPTLAADIAAHLATVTAIDAVGVILPITNNAPLLFPVGNTTVTFTASDAAGNLSTATSVITVSAASIVNVNNATSLATRLTQFDPNITFSLPLATIAANQSGLVETTNFGTLAGAPLTLLQTGIILTTGNVTGTGNNLGPLPGDTDVLNALNGHASFATTGTADAATLQFTFTTPANTPSVSFDLIYASNEALAGVPFPDAVVIMIDGVNRATFTNGLLLANLNGAFLNATNGTLISGYTNLSQSQVLTALVNPLLTSHTIKISIADNNTALTDSAIILSNMRLSASTQNGIGAVGADVQPPVITPAANIAIEATGPTTAVNLGIPNVVDNIDPNPTVTSAPIGPFPIGVTLVTWSATDAAGNIGTATQTVTVSDTIAPAIVAPVAQTFSIASPTMATDIAAYLATVTATDAVGVVLPITNDAPLLFPLGNTTVTFSALDVAANTATATTVITVSSASIINMTNATSLATRLTQFDANINFTLPVATAIANQTGLVETTNFGTLGVAPAAIPLVLPQKGIILTTGNITGTGNNLGPLAGDADVFSALSTHPLFGTAGTSDAASLQFSFTVPVNTSSVDFDLIYATNETLAGIALPDAVVVMVDGVNQATFTNGLLLSNLNGAFLNATNGTLIPGYTNLSQVQTLTALLDPALTTHTIKITIADNTTSATDSALIISNMRLSASANNGMGPLGVDVLAPVVTPAANITIEASGVLTAVNLGAPTVVDNIDPNPLLVAAPISPYPAGATIVTWSATDAAGNIGTATQTVTVTDTTPPVVAAPAPQTFSTLSATMAADIAAHLATVTATDLLGVVLPITNDAPLLFPVGNTTVTFTALDAAGNIGTATTVITVTSASIINITNATSLATRLTQFDPNINFTLPLLTAVPNQVGLVESTSFGTLPTLPPLAAAPLTLPQKGIILTTGNVTGTGNNLGPLLGDTDVFNALSAHPSFATIGTSDGASLQFSFTVLANTPAVDFDLIYATNEALAGTAFPDAVVVMIDGVNRGTFSNGLLLSNLNGAFLNPTNGALISGYTNLSQAQTLTALLNPLLTTHTIKISIADNSSALTDSAIIISNMRVSANTTNGMGPLGTDFLAPVITPAANITIEATGPTTTVNLGVPNVVDNVDPNPVVIPTPAGPYPVGVTIVTWTATDAAGNVSTATQTVTVTDTTLPVVLAPAAQTFSTVSPTLAADIAAHLATVTATDAVGVVLPITNDAPLVFPVGNTTVTFTALDVNGNTGTATTIITVNSASIINMTNAVSLATRLTQFDANINFTLPLATAVVNQTGLVETTNFGTLAATPLSLPQPGIILTTGNVSGTGNNLGPLAGDNDVFNALNTHPSFNTAGTADAASLQFSFTVPANTPSVSFDLIYASNEALAGTAFPDAVVVMVDGINRGTFTNGLLLSNLNGAFLNATNGTLIQGYTNLSLAHTLTTLLDPLLTTHTLKISIADNSTALTDSAIIISNMRTSTSTNSGMGLLGADFLPPVVIPAANITIEATAPTTPVNLGVPNVVDNMDPNPTVAPTPAGPYPVGTTLVTWSATDAAGNIGTATQTVTVTDTTAPVITAPAAQTFSISSPTMAADIAAHLATVTATDLVGLVLPITNDAPIAGFPVGNTTVTFTALDAAGNAGIATTVITVTSASIINITNATSLATRLTQFDANVNFTLPVLTAVPNQVGLVETTNFGTLAAFPPLAGTPLTMPQTGIILTTGNVTGTGNNLGPLAGDGDVFNALTAHPSFTSIGTSDAASLQFSFTVPPNTPSVDFDLIYATNELLAGAPSPDAVVIMVDGVNRATFTNGLLLSNLNGAFLNATNGTLIAGYTNLSQTQVLTALLNPLLTTHTIKISIADNSSALTDSALIISNMRVSNGTQNGIGALGADFLPPVITPTANIAIEATGPTTVVNLGVPNVVDNIDPNPLLVVAPVGPYPVGVTVVTWTATDAAGNVGTATQTITINDTIAPAIVAPAARTFSTASPTMAADIAAHMATVTATDAVGVVLPITNNAPLVFPVGNTTVTYTASDAAGNISTATTVITITAANIIAMSNANTLVTRLTQFDGNINITLPLATAAANQTGLIETTNFGTLAAAPLTLAQKGIMLTTGNITGTGNNIGTPGDTDVFNALNADPAFATTGTVDAASLQFSFTVAPNTPSVSFDLIYATNEALAGVAFPDAVVIMVDGVNRGLFSTGALLANLNGAFLNASNGILISGYTNLSQALTLTTLLDPLLTTHSIKISIADNSNALTDSALIISNMRSSTSTQGGMGVLGMDNFPPVITPPADIITEATALTTAVALGIPTVTDNLDPNPTVLLAPVGPYPVGLTVVTWTATDAAGNVSTALQNVTVTDTTAPLITAPVARTFSTATATYVTDITAHMATAAATDLVGGIVAVVNNAPLVFPVGNTTVTFTATDLAGNISTATTVITVTSATIFSDINATNLATRLTQFDPNITFAFPLATAVTNQTGLVETTNFGLLIPAVAPALPVNLALPQPGIMLTTGNLTGTGNSLGPLPGDTDVFNALSSDPLFNTTGTSDAAALQFTFTVPANTPSVSFDLIYATNELLAAVAFPDAVVIMVDGVNRGTFTSGQLLSNLNGAFLNATNATLIPGYTNVTRAQTLTTLLNPALATHTIKISIADNSSALTDSALLISNMRVSTGTQNGMGPLGTDFLAPVVTAPADVVSEAGAPLTTVNLGVPNVVDNLDPNPTVVPVPAGPYPVGLTVVTWTATDAAGNVGTAIQNVTVQDTLPPTIIAPAVKTFSAFSPTLAADIAAHLATATVTDLVTLAPVMVNDAPLVFPAGNTTVTFTATDAAGNVGTASTFITVSAAAIINNTNAVDLATRLTQFDASITVTAPTLIATANQTGLVESSSFGTLTLPAPALPVALSLPQPGIMLTTGNITGTGNNLGPMPGEQAIFNALINHPTFSSAGTADAASLSFSFTVPANSASVTLDFIFASNEAVAGSPRPDAAVIIVDGINRATFSNGLLLANLNGNLLNASNGTLVAGYANVSQAHSMTVVLDPLLATHTIKIAIADNTDANIDSALILSNMRVTTSTQTGMGTGDFLAPVVIAPADLTAEATGLTTNVNLGIAFAVDNVDPTPVVVPSLGLLPFGPLPLGTTQVTWSSTDLAGNVGTAIQTVTVVDTTPPIVQAAANTIFAASSPAGLPVSSINISQLLVTTIATDAVGIRSITNDAPPLFPVGTTRVTFTATDISGNVTTGFTDILITPFVAAGGVNAIPNGTDQIPPVLKLVGSNVVTVLQTALPATYADPGVMVNDNFDGPIAMPKLANNTIDTSIAGSTALVYSASDTSGNTAQIVRMVHVVALAPGIDQLPPIVTLGPIPSNPVGHDIFVGATSFAGILSSDTALNGFFSNATVTAADDPTLPSSGLATAVLNDAPAIIAIGKTVVTFSVTDNAGNIGSATATITVSGVVQSIGNPLDFDGDSMPDDWEISVFGDPLLKVAGPGTDFDLDGVSDALERLLGTNPLLANSNPSGASTDLKDLLDLSNPSDSDGDGIIDALEDNISALDPTMATGIPSPNGSTTFSINGGANVIQSIAVTQIPANPPFNILQAHGLLSYNVLTAVGGSATIQINSTQPFGTNSQFYKVDAVGNYSLIPAANVTMIGANTISLTLTDGGPFDLDGIANGVIVDPIAFGAAPAVLGANSGAAGGGGCAIQTDATFDPLLPLLFTIALLFLLMRRKQSMMMK